MKLEEARKILIQEQLEVSPHWFCPLTINYCNMECVCFENASLVGNTGDYEVKPAYCSNEMFKK